jgi:rhodanese-related sulfurtransferase
MKEITASEVQERLEAGEILNIIDVRESEEVAEGHIDGIIHIPLGELQERIDDLDKDKEYFLVCRSGARSGKAASYLESVGFKVTNILGGMLTWKGKVVKKFKIINTPLGIRRDIDVH